MSRFFIFLLMIFVIHSSHAREAVRLDPRQESRVDPSGYRGVLEGVATGQRCSLDLMADRQVRIPATCGLHPNLKLIRTWQIEGLRLTLRTADGRVVLRFSRTGDGAPFRSGPLKPEPLLLKLFPAVSVPLSR